MTKLRRITISATNLTFLALFDFRVSEISLARTRNREAMILAEILIIFTSQTLLFSWPSASST